MSATLVARPEPLDQPPRFALRRSAIALAKAEGRAHAARGSTSSPRAWFSPSEARGIGFGWLSRLPPDAALEWLERRRFVEVQHEIELVRQPRREVVARAFGARQVDDANRAFEMRHRKRARQLEIVTQRQEHFPDAGVVEQPLVAAGHRRPHDFSLGRLIP